MCVCVCVRACARMCVCDIVISICSFIVHCSKMNQDGVSSNESTSTYIALSGFLIMVALIRTAVCLYLQ